MHAHIREQGTVGHLMEATLLVVIMEIHTLRIVVGR